MLPVGDIGFDMNSRGSNFTGSVTSSTHISGRAATRRSSVFLRPGNHGIAELRHLSNCQWLNTTAQPINLSLYNGIARFKARYTPQPGWAFTAGYWQNHNVGDRAFGTLFGTSPGSYNITELAEPIDYQTYNIELGGEYAANGWSVGLKYNGSIFDNLRNSIVWDNPMNLTGVGAACRDSATLNYTTGTGACRGRMDLYPNNQAHTVTLSGAARLPIKQFLGQSPTA
jgi:hypothetical protein